MSSTDEEFAKFVKFCEQNLTGANKQLISLIKKRYNDCNEKFKKSRELRHLLSSSRKKMSSDSKHLFVHLKDCLNELKAYSGSKGEKRKRKTEYDSDDHLSKKSKLANGNILDSEETDSSVKSRSLTSSPVVLEEDSDKEVKSEQTSKAQEKQWRDKLKISPDVASRKLHTANLATIIKNLKEKKLGESESESLEAKPSVSCLKDSAEDKSKSADLAENKPALGSISGKSDAIKCKPCHDGDSTVEGTTSGSGKLASNSTTDSGPDETTSGSTVKPGTSDCKKDDEDDDCIIIDDSPPCEDEHTTSNASSKSKAATTNKLSLTKSGSSESTQSRPDLSPENDSVVKGKLEASDAETATTNTASDSLPSKSEEISTVDPVSEHLPDTDSKQCCSGNNDAIENNTVTNPEQCNDDIKVKNSDEDLEKVDIPSVTLNDQEVIDIDLEKIDIPSDTHQNVTDVDLEKADITSVTLNDQEVTDVELEKADIPSDTHQNVTDVDLEKADKTSDTLNDQEVTDVDLEKVDIPSVTLNDQEVIDVDLEKVDIPSDTHQNVTDVDLEKVDIPSDTLNDQEVTDVELEKVDIPSDTLNDQDVTDVDLEKVDIPSDTLNDQDDIKDVDLETAEQCNDDIKVKNSDVDLKKVDIPSDTLNDQDITDVDLQKVDIPLDTLNDQDVTDVDLETADTSSKALKEQNVTDADLHQDIKEVCSESTETKTDNPEQTEIMDTTEPVSPKPDAFSDQDTNSPVASPDIHTATSSNVASVCSIAVESDSDHGESSTLISEVKEFASTEPEPSCSTDVPDDITTATKSPRSPGSPASASCSEDKKNYEKEKKKEKKEKKKREVSAKHIHRLEKLLEKLRDKIDRVQERELTLDDLDQEDSDYLFEDKLKKKFVAVWNKLCELKERAPSTGRPTERRFTYQGTRYPEVNKKIEKMINKKKIFPDFHDIRRLVAKVNINHKLHLSNPAVDSLAREAFTDVGNMLQHRRREDFVTTFGCKMTDTVDVRQDPAMFDPELRRKLDDNKTQGKAKLEDVIRKYSDMQHSRGDIPEEVPEGSDIDKSDAEKSEDELEVVAVTIEDLDSDNEDIILVESSPAKMIQPREPRSPSPQARIPSPRVRTSSPQLNTPSPQPGTPSPQPGTSSPKQVSPLPQQSTPLPQARTSSPLVTTPFREARTPSPLQITTSPQPRTPSPELITSPQLKTPSPELITSPQLKTPSPELMTSARPRTPSPELITSPQPRTPSPELITASSQPRTPSPEILAQSPVIVSPCGTPPVSHESTDGSPKTIQPRSPCSSPLVVKKSSPPKPESPQTIQPRYAARVSPSSPIEIDDSVIVSDSDDEELSPIKTADCSFAPSFAKSSFDSNPVTSTVKKETLIPANFGGKPFGPSVVNSESAGAGRNYVWTNSRTSNNAVKRLSLHNNSPSTSSLSMSASVKMAATVKPFSVHKQPSSPLYRSHDHMSQSSSFRQNTKHNRLSLHKSPSASMVKQTIVNRTSGPSRQVRQSPQREWQHSQVMHNRVMQQTGQRQGGGSRQMPQTYNRMSQQTARTQSGGSQPFVRQYSGSSQQMTRPRNGVSQQVSRHGSGISQQTVRRGSGVSQQVMSSQGRVYPQTSRSQSGMTSQMTQPRGSVSQQMARPHNVVSQQLTRPRSGMSQQMVQSRGGLSHQVIPQRGMPQQALHKRNGASRNISQSFKKEPMSPLKQAMQMSSQCYIDIDDSAEEVWNEEEGGMEQDKKGNVMEDGEDVVILSDSDD